MADLWGVVLGAVISLGGAGVLEALRFRRDSRRADADAAAAWKRRDEQLVVEYLDGANRWMWAIQESRMRSQNYEAADRSVTDAQELEFYRRQFTALVGIGDVELRRLIDEQEPAILVMKTLSPEVPFSEFAARHEDAANYTERLVERCRHLRDTSVTHDGTKPEKLNKGQSSSKG